MSGAVCVRAPIAAGALPALRATLAAADADCRSGRSALSRVAGVHFARFMIVPGDASLIGGAAADTLVYTADTDASVSRHLRDLDQHAGPLLDAVFGSCVGYRSAAGASRLTWLRAHRVASAATYLNTLGMTVERIDIEARANDWVQGFLDDHRTELVALRPGEIHARMRTALAGDEPGLASTLMPALPEPLATRLRRWAVLIGAVLLVLVLLPLLVVVGVPCLLALRLLERRDQSDCVRADRAQVERLRAHEDAFALNPFGALGVVKPGALRAATVKIVLIGIAIAASTIFVRGSLAGVTTIHVARWVPLDGGRRMIFTSCYDGSLESYMNDFIDKLSWGLNVIFSNGVGYPRTRWLILDGARDEQTFKDYLRAHQLETAMSYAAHPTLTTANIRTNAAVRRDLAEPVLDDERAAAWLALL